MESEKLFNDFFSTNKNEIEIEAIIREYWIVIDNYIINNDGTIDVNGDVRFPKTMGFLTELPLKFNKVSGDFDCSRLKLNTLKGSPIEVGGNFDCTFNPLTSLEHAPKKVGKTFAFDNTIKSLFTGGKNSNFNEVQMFIITDIPELIELPDIITENITYLPIILKYQNFYYIWNEDDNHKFNHGAFEDLLEDIRDGLE